VEVRIQDRGPFVDGRIIDLSRAAARSIDMIGPGIVKVRLTVISPPKLAAIQQQPELFAVQAGAFRDRARAEAVSAVLEKFGTVRIVERAANQTIYRVLVGEAEVESEAGAIAERIRAAGYEAFVVRLDRPDNSR
jgi:rare lipoprotein A